MDVLASFDGEYHIKLTIRNKVDNFIWSLVAVYERPKMILRLAIYVSWLILQRTIHI
jgi:hypothetical protein